jgi:aspartate aminotransferase-like enzyme
MGRRRAGEGIRAHRLGADTKHDEIKAVFVTHNETATGVTSDIAGVRRALDACFHDALLFVDGVSSIASIDFRMDEWGVDLAVTGSQKGLMLPAGLGILGVSQKAMEASRSATMRRAYFEFADMAKTNADGYFPYTPPTPLLHGLRAALDRVPRGAGRRDRPPCAGSRRGRAPRRACLGARTGGRAPLALLRHRVSHPHPRTSMPATCCASPMTR